MLKWLGRYQCILLLFLFGFSSTTFGLELCDRRFAVETSGISVQFPFCSTHSITTPNREITSAIISVHSSSYDAVAYLDYAQSALFQTGAPGASTLIVAPHFLKRDRIDFEISNTLLYWLSDPWWGTRDAAYGPAETKIKVSAFTVLDSILSTIALTNTFPNLRHIVVLGHSAGGQFTNRYAATNLFQQSLDSTRSIEIRYMVLAPSSYLYFDTQRAVDSTKHQFSIPDAGTRSECPNYNHYGYGLEDLWAYPSQTTPAGIRNNYQQRTILYLIGENDNLVDSGLSTTCMSMLQGPNRLDRQKTYLSYLSHYFGSEIQDRHRMEIVPGVGHSGKDLLASSPSVQFLTFKTDDKDSGSKKKNKKCKKKKAKRRRCKKKKRKKTKKKRRL